MSWLVGTCIVAGLAFALVSVLKGLHGLKEYRCLLQTLRQAAVDQERREASRNANKPSNRK